MTLFEIFRLKRLIYQGTFPVVRGNAHTGGDMETATEVQPEYLTYADACRYSGLSRQTIWRAIKAGDVEAFKIGRSVKISRRSLEEYVRAEPVETE